jgi:hypothetical protein
MPARALHHVLMVRVRSVEDAKRLRDELEDDGPRRHRPPDVAAPTGAGAAGVVAGPADRIELDYAELSEAENRLTALHDELSARLREAGRLEGPFGDGNGPVALHMRRAFGLRGGEEGVQAALRTYLEELGELREALRAVGATHRAEDEQIAEGMKRL